jgi:butyrate kinase
LHKEYRVLAINPGSTSTKIAVYTDNTCLFEQIIRHSTEDLKQFRTINDQFEFRRSLVEKELEKRQLKLSDLDAIVGRGGPLKPMESGTYLVNDKMCNDLWYHVQTEHVSKLGGLIARSLADKVKISAFIVDPVSVDELEPIARITGMTEIKRRSLFHALNLKAVAHRVANDLGSDYSKLTFIMVHLGGGISVGIQQNGRMTDVSNPNDLGPFSPERAGTIPTGELVKMCFSGRYSLLEMENKLIGKAGLVAHLGTNDAREVEQRIEKGDPHAALIYKAMAYQVAKEIGAMATVASGKVDAIVLTGGLAHSKMLVEWIKERVEFIGKVYIYPGEDELQALVEGTLRVLRREEPAKQYE